MADGLNVSFTESMLDYFDVDDIGFCEPKPGSVQIERVWQRLKRQLNAKTRVWREASRKAVSTELSSDNPAGNTQVIGGGWRIYGPPVVHRPKGIATQRKGISYTDKDRRALQARSHIFYDETKALLDYVDSLKPDPNADPRKYAQWLFERHQATSGFAFDNNTFGDITRSAASGLREGLEGASQPLDPNLRKLVVEHAHRLRRELTAAGLQAGSLSPYGATLMRGLQENDGLIPVPVFAHAFDEFDSEMATSLIIDSDGLLNVRKKVGTVVHGLHGEPDRKYAVIDAAADFLDKVPLSHDMLVPVVTMLQRIQKTGIIEDKEGYDAPWGIHYPFRQKPGKARSVNPLSLVPAILEAMIFSAFNDAVKGAKYELMPSLQDPETRRHMVTDCVKAILDAGYQPFDLDFSGYDKTLLMSIMTTIIQIAVKPFFKAEWHDAVDAACFIHTYKVYMMDTQFLNRFAKEDGDWLREHTQTFQAGGFTFVYSYASWMSGIKFTHVGGSLYGNVIAHGAMIELACQILGVDPIKIPHSVPGVQGGDDFLGAWLASLVKDGISAEDALTALKKAADAFHLKFNTGKLWWVFYKGEKLNIFLQDLYHVATNNLGVGSAFRGAAAWGIVERDKSKLPINEQATAVVGKMTQGANSEFIDDALQFVMERDLFLAYVFKTYQHEGLKVLYGTDDPQELLQLASRVGVDEYHWGWTREQLASGECPILENLVRVGAKIQVDINDLSEEAQTYLRGCESPPTGGLPLDDEFQE